MLGRCVVANCSGGNSDSQPLFRFPLDSERCKQWLEQCQRQDLIEKPTEQLYKYERICRKHFEPSAIDSEAPACVVLKDDAVPTVFDGAGGPQSNQGKRKETVKVIEKETRGRKKIKKAEPEPEPDKGDNEATPVDHGNEYLKTLFEVLLLFGGQNVLPTGQGEDNQGSIVQSNFQALLEYRFQSGDEIMQKKWEENKEKFPNELKNIIDACEQCIRAKLVEEVMQNGPFSLLTDELVMISRELCLPVFVRFVDQSNCQQERFLGFVSFSGDEDVLAEKALSEITEKWGLKMEQCRGQAHSCSGTHSSKIKKFAAKVAEKFPAALNTLRSTQTVNLSVANKMAVSGVQLVLSTFKNIESFFSRSPLLGVEFEQTISLCYADREEKANAIKAIFHSNWTNSYNAFEVGFEIYESLLVWLDSVNEDEDVRWSDQVAQEAMVISKALTDFEFLMTLIVLKNITALTKAFGKNMQGDAADVSSAADSLPAVLMSIKEVIDNIDVYHEFWFEEAMNVGAAVDVPVKVPRSFVRKHSESVAIQPENYYKEHVSLAVVQGIYQELGDAFSEGILKTLKGLSLVPAAIEQKKSVKLEDDCVQFFKNDVPNAEALTAEFNCWWVKWSKKSKQESFVSNIEDTLQLADMKFFPNMMAIFQILAIVPCLPLGSAFSVAYKRFKRYLENVPNRLSSKSIAFMNINSHVQCDLDSMVELYVKNNPKEKDA